MKASLVMTAFVFACTLSWALRAQQAPQGAPREHSMIGCLQNGTDPGTFKLTDVEKAPADVEDPRVKTVEIVESTVNLQFHVTHKIEIIGTAVTGEYPNAHTMKVTAMKMVGECP